MDCLDCRFAQFGIPLEVLILLGLDVAWGLRNPDGLCWGRVQGMELEVLSTQVSHGDEELLRLLENRLGGESCFLAMDGPVICRNHTGSRPVDRLAQQMFRTFHSGPHPVNLQRCQRPIQLVEKLRRLGFVPGWKVTSGGRLISEVFPHPTLVRWAELPQIIKYKRGLVADKRKEFSRLQSIMSGLLETRFRKAVLSHQVRQLLHQPWSKAVEDQTDALICLLLAWQHVSSRGEATETLGDLQSGFLLLPKCNGAKNSHGCANL